MRFDALLNKQLLFRSNNWLVSITDMACVYCAVRTKSLNIIHVNHNLKISVFPCQYHSTNFHLHVSFTRTTKGRRLGTFQKNNAVSEIGENWVEKYFYVLVFVWLRDILLIKL